jgi:hypothetical protein
MRFVLATPRTLKSSLAALRRGLEELYPVPQELPDSIGRALARLESPRKASLRAKMPMRKQRPKNGESSEPRHGQGYEAFFVTAY